MADAYKRGIRSSGSLSLHVCVETAWVEIAPKDHDVLECRVAPPHQNMRAVYHFED
jgi:hypothetical protein